MAEENINRGDINKLTKRLWQEIANVFGDVNTSMENSGVDIFHSDGKKCSFIYPNGDIEIVVDEGNNSFTISHRIFNKDGSKTVIICVSNNEIKYEERISQHSVECRGDDQSINFTRETITTFSAPRIMCDPRVDNKINQITQYFSSATMVQNA